MRTEDFSFDLPEELIAQFPPERRGESRLLVLDRATGTRTHTAVRDLASLVEPGTLMVFNDSRVRKARVYAEALDTGSKVEFLLLRRLGPAVWEAAAMKLKRQRPGRRYRFAEGVEAVVVGDWPGLPPEGDTRVLSFDPPIEEDYLERNGHVPLPPYIRREDAVADAERYQTVFARRTGSAASPTAGLHFTGELLDSLAERGVLTASVTLHVGLGTFIPVRAETLEEHTMHEESYTVPEETAEAVRRAKAEGRPVLAVGTTSLRSLESAWARGRELGMDGLAPGPGSTRIFIYPGYSFRVVDLLFTNFHTPRSTLLMLVSAFAGRERILEAYAEAVAMRYRFFSYGDAMLIK
ncbi:MAG TPA: tRNA preQ1(34) S-adenosylmethionine ribosyltransferase-isomerase QueA [Rectinemataceae bacterium]|nr:tRNA preQ1(34) S-adenosylmethionine ribosyltransferase-isomerase QueA [Rectinemataceae bacterium]